MSVLVDSVHNSAVMVLLVSAFLQAAWHRCVFCVLGDQFVDQLLSPDLSLFMAHARKAFAAIESTLIAGQKGRNSTKNIRLSASGGNSVTCNPFCQL